MPVEIIKYLCQFKCGTKAKSTIAQIRHHEAVCFKNPQARACSTCKHEVYEREVISVTDPYPISKEVMSRSCNKVDEKEFENLIIQSDYHSQPIFHKHPVRHCPHWESRIELPAVHECDATKLNSSNTADNQK